MSITFSIAGVPVDLDRAATFLNLNNVNACDLLRWLELPADPIGEIPARELAARCRRRLWDEARNHDAEQPGELAVGAHARTVLLGREAGYLRQRTAELLALAEAAGDGQVRWA